MQSAAFDQPIVPALPLPLAGVTIVVPGIPVARGRARATSIGGRARLFTPAKTRRYEDLVRLEAARITQGKPQFEGALAVTLRAYVQTPQAISRHKVKGPSAEAGVIRPLTRPDLDNYIKQLDCLNGIVFHDDSQIVELKAEKFYSARPRLEITVVEL
jgi:Holliday junction resolvase RusA-like endonuclease